jgi:hypothetical protein
MNESDEHRKVDIVLQPPDGIPHNRLVLSKYILEPSTQLEAFFSGAFYAA